jgi:excisionase family DNA binding protein
MMQRSGDLDAYLDNVACARNSISTDPFDAIHYANSSVSCHILTLNQAFPGEGVVAPEAQCFGREGCPRIHLKGRNGMERQLLTTNEAARALSVGRSRIYQLINSGKLVSIKVGTSRRIPAGEITAYIERALVDTCDGVA